MIVDVRVREANLHDPADAAGFLFVLNTYASDPAGGAEPLEPEVLDRLIPALKAHPAVLVLLAFVGADVAGIAVGFFGLSTFRARPLLNIHDLAVVPEHRGCGVGRALLQEAESRAREKGCCRLTLEVQDANARARGLYLRFGFDDFVVHGSPTRFLCKPLEP